MRAVLNTSDQVSLAFVWLATTSRLFIFVLYWIEVSMLVFGWLRHLGLVHRALDSAFFTKDLHFLFVKRLILHMFYFRFWRLCTILVLILYFLQFLLFSSLNNCLSKSITYLLLHWQAGGCPTDFLAAADWLGKLSFSKSLTQNVLRIVYMMIWANNKFGAIFDIILRLNGR